MTDKSGFKWDDPFFFDDQLNEEERLVRDSARDYAQNKLMPRVLEMHRTSLLIGIFSMKWVSLAFMELQFQRNTAEQN